MHECEWLLCLDEQMVTCTPLQYSYYSLETLSRKLENIFGYANMNSALKMCLLGHHNDCRGSLVVQLPAQLPHSKKTVGSVPSQAVVLGLCSQKTCKSLFLSMLHVSPVLNW